MSDACVCRGVQKGGLLDMLMNDESAVAADQPAASAPTEANGNTAAEPAQSDGSQGHDQGEGGETDEPAPQGESAHEEQKKENEEEKDDDEAAAAATKEE
jgi:hypothetical protein